MERLAEIIDELLVLSQAGERELPGERLERRELLEQAPGALGGTAAERGIALEAVRCPDGPSGAPGRCRAGLDVLLENALAYAPPGSAVTLAATRRADRGARPRPGPEPVRRTIFERFHRGSAGRGGPRKRAGPGNRTRPGAGLGRRRDLENREGGGAIATVSLPEEPA